MPVRHTVFPLHPETPEEGRSLKDLFAGQFDIGVMMNRLHQVANELNVPFGERTYTYNSRRAQELGKWAERQQVGEAFRQAVYHGYFVDGLNIAKPDVLIDIANQIGLEQGEAEQVLRGKTFAEDVDQDWQRSREQDVTAVPTVIYQGQRLVGFRPYEDLCTLIRH